MASIEYHRKYRAAHREAYREYARQERLANPEVIKERQKRWRQTHAEIMHQAQLQWRNANRERVREYDAKYRAEHREKEREIENRRRARRVHQSIGSISSEQIEGKWAYWGGLCWMCGARATETDHVKPLAKGGAHLLCNLRPICKPCNSRKKAHWPVDTSRRAR